MNTLSNTVSLEALAHAMSSKFDMDDNAKATFAGLIKAKEDSARGTVVLLTSVLIPNFSDVIDQWPAYLVDPDKKLPNPAEIKLKVGDRTITTDFYKILTDDIMVADVTIVRECAKALSKDGAIAQSALSPWKEWSKDRVASAKKAAEARLTYGRRTVRDAAALYRKIKEIHSVFDGITQVSFMPGDDGKGISRSPWCIMVEDIKQPRIYGTLSAPQCIDLDIDEAVAKGKSTQSLLDTIKRGTNKATGARTTATMPEAKNAIEAVQHAVVFANYVDGKGEAKDDKAAASIVEACRKDKHTLLTVGRACIATDTIWRAIEELYNVAAAEEAQADVAARKAKLAANAGK